ncbi:MAG TPA: hypothetical protein VLC07_05015, partial [Solirubrobacterales bacterium]|nr:hypothetical protein [Solirubrobacterales bacterium]
ECAARTEIARAGVEEARKKQEAATAQQEAATARLEQQWAEADARWEKEQAAMRKAREERALEIKAILADLKEGRDERRALIEAMFQVMDRLDGRPPPPPDPARSE